MKLKTEVLGDLRIQDKRADHDQDGMILKKKVHQGVVSDHQKVELHLEEIELLPESTGVDLVVVEEVVLDSPHKNHDSHCQEGCNGNEKEK